MKQNPVSAYLDFKEEGRRDTKPKPTTCTIRINLWLAMPIYCQTTSAGQPDL